MKGILARLRPGTSARVIVVLAGTREEAERGVRHALGGASGLPVWVFCAAPADPDFPSLEGCGRFFSGATASSTAAALKGVWPALTIVAWTGQRGPASFKLLPFTRPPFRILVLNEAGDFFPPRPNLVAAHARRRLRDLFQSAVRRSEELRQAGPRAVLVAGLSHLAGANRPRVVVVLGTTRSEVEWGAKHAGGGAVRLPIRGYCLEAPSGEQEKPAEGCDRFRAGFTAREVAADLKSVWPALSVVAWTGRSPGGSFAFKLLPFQRLPFRVVIFNEAGDFFPPRPAYVAAHLKRRMRDGLVSAARRTQEWLVGAAQWLRSSPRHISDMVRHQIAVVTGATRPRVVVLFAATASDVELALGESRNAAGKLPLWIFCGERFSLAESPLAKRLNGRDRFEAGASIASISKELSTIWPALSIVGWTGAPGSVALKLLPFTLLPLRISIFNEAGDFFVPAPQLVWVHGQRRCRDGLIAQIRTVTDFVQGAAGWASRMAFQQTWWIRRWLEVNQARVALRYRELRRDIPVLAAEFVLSRLGVIAPHASGFAIETVSGLRHRSWPAMRLPEATASSHLEITIRHRAWPGRAIAKQLRESDAEFVVFRHGRNGDNPQELIALARQTGSFAVARQSAHSAWRKRVLAKFPFRKLQPGEASEVLAPASPLIVVRRAALLEIGCPEAWTWGAALMILFWKSSALGLRTLTVGHADAITDEMAMALEDVEFALRLKLAPGLGSMGPDRPAKHRGNLCFSVTPPELLPQPPRRGSRRKPRVLVVSPYLPFPLSHGGAVRIYSLCKALANEVDFTLACFREANESVRYSELLEVFREVYVVDADEKKPDPSAPKQISEYRNPAMADLVSHLCLERKVDIVQLEYTQTAEYRDHTGAIPVILVEHDITFTLYQQLAKNSAGTKDEPLMKREHELWLAFEREALQCSNMVWTMSGDDRAVAVEHGAPRERTVVIPNGVDLQRFQPRPRVSGAESGGIPTVLFVGSFRHLPNLLAFESLRESIMPAVWAECPEARLHVIGGPHHAEAAKRFNKAHLLEADARIRIDGFVEDVRPAYENADIVAIPLPVSAGTNIKLMEALACRRAIVSTPVGCHGLNLENGRELFVANLGEAFSRAIVSLLQDAGLRERIAAEGRRTAERRFGWDAISREALGSYASLLQEGSSEQRHQTTHDRIVA